MKKDESPVRCTLMDLMVVVVVCCSLLLSLLLLVVIDGFDVVKAVLWKLPFRLRWCCGCVLLLPS